MVFANLTYLLAGVGIMVPIAIHLWYKKEGKVIPLGSLRFLPEQATPQSRSLNFNELLLLALRVLLLLLLAILMAQPLIQKDVPKQRNIALVAPEVADYPQVSEKLKTLENRYEVRWLDATLSIRKEGTPSDTSETVPGYWQALTYLDDLAPDTIIVFAPPRISCLHGKRPALNAKVEWLPLPGLDNKYFIQYAEESMPLYWSLGQTNALNTTFIQNGGKDMLQWAEDSSQVGLLNDDVWVTVTPPDTLNIVLYADSQFAREKALLMNAFRTVEAHVNTKIFLKEMGDSSKTEVAADWLVWLSDTEPPDGAKYRLVWHDTSSSELISAAPVKNTVYLTGNLTVNKVVESHLPYIIYTMLGLSHDPVMDYREAAIDQVLPNIGGRSDKLKKAESASADHWLWPLWFIIFGLERFISHIRRQ